MVLPHSFSSVQPAARPLAGDSLVIYRAISGGQAEAADFLSNRRKGKKPRRSEITNPQEHDAVSCWDSLDKLRELAAQFPQLGTYAAEVHVAPGARVEALQEGDPGHWNLYGEPEDMLACVRTVHRLR